MQTTDKQFTTIDDALDSLIPLLAATEEEYQTRNAQKRLAEDPRLPRGTAYHPHPHRRENIEAAYVCAFEQYPLPGRYVFSEEMVKRHALRYAKLNADAWRKKLNGKLPGAKVSKVTFAVNGRIVVEAQCGGFTVVLHQQPVHKWNLHGTRFVQWPARIYVDGQFTPEAKFKRMLAA